MQISDSSSFETNYVLNYKLEVFSKYAIHSFLIYKPSSDVHMHVQWLKWLFVWIKRGLNIRSRYATVSDAFSMLSINTNTLHKIV